MPRRSWQISGWADAASARVKAWWSSRHALHVFLAVAGAFAAAITMFITVHGFWVYVSEAPARAEQNRLLRLQTVNAAWDMVRTTKGSRTERGQSFALQTLAESGINLAGLDLANTSIDRAVLRGAQLHEANLSGVTLSRVALDGGGMTGASMTGAILERVTMDHMGGLPATLENAFVLDTVMSSQLESGLVASAPMDLRSALVVHSTLDLPINRMDVRGACLIGVNFHLARSSDDPDSYWGAVLRMANFSSSIIAGGTFRRADLDGADFRNVRFVPPSAFSRKITEIREATNYQWTDATDAQIAELRTRGRLPLCLARQRNLMLVLNRVEEAAGEAVTPQGSCCFSNADRDLWLGAGRHVTDFTGASLKGTRFENADLRATSGIEQVELDQACIDDHTRLPRGLRRPPSRCVQVVQDEQGSVQSIIYETDLDRDIEGPPCCIGNPNTRRPIRSGRHVR